MSSIDTAVPANTYLDMDSPDEPTVTIKPEKARQLPVWLVASVLSVCSLPLMLNGLGISFDAIGDYGQPVSAALSDAEHVDSAIRMLKGTYVHTLLEWTATVVAMFAAMLAFTHFRISRDVVTPIIGIALLSAGLVDAFHTLAADRLIEATSDNRVFIPFTWAISRTFNSVIPLTALALFFFTRRFAEHTSERQSLTVLASASLAIVALAYIVIRFCATSTDLPQTMFPDAAIGRPWDVYPLAVYAVSGLFVYPLFNRRMNTYFSQALWLSVVPDLATQLHMAFGSTMLFDNHFNIAHFLKIIAYMVPCIGLILDYVATHEKADELQIAVSRRAEELARSNADLEKFAYIASHDLKAPLRAIDNLSLFIEEDLDEVMGEDTRTHMTRLRGRVRRLEHLLDDLLQYSRVGKETSPPVFVRTEQLLADIVEIMDLPAGTEVSVLGTLPAFHTDKAPLEMVLRNLVGNAVKHHDRPTAVVEVSCRETNGFYTFSVADDGPGIAEDHQERIFEMFQTLAARDRKESSGMGLAVVKKIVALHKGNISVISGKGQRGSKFVFDWPKRPEEQ